MVSTPCSVPRIASNGMVPFSVRFGAIIWNGMTSFWFSSPLSCTWWTKFLQLTSFLLTVSASPATSHRSARLQPATALRAWEGEGGPRRLRGRGRVMPPERQRAGRAAWEGEGEGAPPKRKREGVAASEGEDVRCRLRGRGRAPPEREREGAAVGHEMGERTGAG
jgi:hypothetical protein